MRRASAWVRGILLLGLVFLLGAFILKPAPSPGPAKRKAVVVELFTSEGCSSCPPADELLSRMRQNPSTNGAEIITLGFHVDYWDHQGWRDRFSSHAYTQRQEQYAARFRLEGPYTPQMVIDGGAEFVGNDSRRAQQTAGEAAARPQQAEIQISANAPDQLLVGVNAAENISGEVRLAITEDNLMSKVGAGENDGRELHHSAVVRDFRLLGQLKHGRFEGQARIKAAPDWKTKDLRCVLLVQEPSNGAVLGAASLPWTSLSAGK